MEGMMGSLLIVRGGEFAFTLPAGVPCPEDSAGPVSGKAVSLAGSQFAPQNLMVPVGTTVTWTWDESDQHSVTSDTGVFDSGVLSSATPPFPSFPWTFTTPGTFPYHCQIHGAPGGIGMSGTITVM
jgi:plastocyanin